MAHILKFLKLVCITVLFTVLIGKETIHAQSWRTKPFSIAVLNNSTQPFPKSLGATFKGQIQPGIEITYEFGWHETMKSGMFRNINTHALGGKRLYSGKWFQNVGLAWYYHQDVNHAFTLTTKAGYRKYFGKFSAEAGIHVGVLHALPLKQSVQQSDGSWRTQRDPGKFHLITGIGVGVGYDAGYQYNIRRIFVNYDYRIQLPFSDFNAEYLPNGLLSVGLQFTLFKDNTSNKRNKKERLECVD